jgi:hypothetical protein
LNPHKLVTLTSFDNAVDAQLLRSKLDSEGIPAFVFDENVVSLVPMTYISLGGIKVKVRESDLVSAQEVMNITSKNPIRDEDNLILVCPVCQSIDITPGVKTTSIFSFAFWGLLFGVYPLQIENKFICNSCKNIFKRGEAKTPQVS